MPPVRRAFINEYGIREYEAWRASRQPMKNYEAGLRSRLGYLDTTPVVWNEYGHLN